MLVPSHRRSILGRSSSPLEDADSAVTEHSFTVQRNPEDAACIMARGMGHRVLAHLWEASLSLYLSAFPVQSPNVSLSTLPSHPHNASTGPGTWCLRRGLLSSHGLPAGLVPSSAGSSSLSLHRGWFRSGSRWNVVMCRVHRLGTYQVTENEGPPTSHFADIEAKTHKVK